MREEIYPFHAEGQDGIPLSFSIAGISYCDGNYQIRRTHAEVACIEYILSGRGTVVLDGRTFYPVAGDTYFLPVGHDHLYYADEADPWVKIWVNFGGPLAASMTDLYALGDRCRFPGLYTEDLLRSMLRVAQERRPNTLLQATLLLHEMFFRMARTEQGTVKNSAARALRDFIDRHYTEPIGTADFAAAIGKSPSQCSRIFQHAYGETPSRYLLDRRLALSRVLLENSGMSVREIASGLSFCDAYYFSNLFKKRTGKSPTAYRAHLRTGDQK